MRLIQSAGNARRTALDAAGRLFPNRKLVASTCAAVPYPPVFPAGIERSTFDSHWKLTADLNRFGATARLMNLCPHHRVRAVPDYLCLVSGTRPLVEIEVVLIRDRLSMPEKEVCLSTIGVLRVPPSQRSRPHGRSRNARALRPHPWL